MEDRRGQSGILFGAAIIATAFAIGGIVEGFVQSGVANTLCNATGSLVYFQACSNARGLATIAHAIGVASLVFAIALWVMVLKDS